MAELPEYEYEPSSPLPRITPGAIWEYKAIQSMNRSRQRLLTLPPHISIQTSGLGRFPPPFSFPPSLIFIHHIRGGLDASPHATFTSLYSKP